MFTKTGKGSSLGLVDVPTRPVVIAPAPRQVTSAPSKDDKLNPAKTVKSNK
jgi:hypothetical protein